MISTNDTSDSWDLPNKFLTGGISSLLICLVGIYQKSVWLGVFWYLRFDSGGFTETVICRWDFAYLESDAVNYAIHEAVREYSALIVWRLGNCCFGFWHELFHKIPKLNANVKRLSKRSDKNVGPANLAWHIGTDLTRRNPESINCTKTQAIGRASSWNRPVHKFASHMC